MIGHVKSIKISGLAQKLSSTIANLRLTEINAASPFRLLAATTSSLAQLPLMISPVVAFGLFTIVASRTGETLDSTRMFAALSIIVLLAQPLFLMFEVVLDMGAALACFQRIEKYLRENARVEYREISNIDAETPPVTPGSPASGGIELQVLRNAAVPHSAESTPRNGHKIAVHGASFSWSQDGPATIEDISFSVPDSQLVMVIGPVASGKTTLLNGILGEVPHTMGSVRFSMARCSWCEQSPWLIVSTTKHARKLPN